VPGSLGHSPDGISVDELYHVIKIEKNSRLHDIFNEDRMFVNSFHHQAIKRLGDGLVISAMSEDGIIEGMESTKEGFLIGIQSHPECLTKRYSMFLSPFEALVQAAANSL
jgi:putative glutamine amidotransferase